MGHKPEIWQGSIWGLPEWYLISNGRLNADLNSSNYNRRRCFTGIKFSLFFSKLLKAYNIRFLHVNYKTHIDLFTS